jgi:diguanylate cyclase (GGDEF)-like protein
MLNANPCIVMALVCAGTALLIASLVPVRDILRVIRAGSLRRNWLFLTTLIMLFIPGYATFGWLSVRNHPAVVDLVVAAILFFGGCFVFGVVHLSRQTAESLLRVARLEQDALIDPLTQLSNRRYLSRRFSEEISRAHRHHLNLTVIMVDIDHFKMVNDVYGHRTGDEVLCRIARVIEGELRTSDIAVRYGGDEILVIATNTDAPSGKILAERLRRAIREEAIPCDGGVPILITVSIGVATLLLKECTRELIDRVDRALYEAKRQGRDQVCAAPRGAARGADDAMADACIAEPVSK